MDRIFLELAFFTDTDLHVLVHVLGQEGHVRTHQDVDLQEHIKEDIDAGDHVLFADFTSDSAPVEADVPVGKEFQKLD